MDNIQIIYDLLYYVQANYPIGIPELYDQPRLYSKRDQIVHEKLKLNQSMDLTPWKELVAASSAIFGDVNDFGYRQFPGYLLRAKVYQTNVDFNDIHFSREIALCISLLCPYFTAFYIDEYKFNDIKSAQRMSVPCFRIVSKQAIASVYNNEVSKMQALLDQVSRFFPEHEFVNHSIILKNTLTNGVRLEAQGAAGSLPIFSYLFDDSFQLKNLDIQD